MTDVLTMRGGSWDGFSDFPPYRNKSVCGCAGTIILPVRSDACRGTARPRAGAGRARGAV